MIKLKKVKYKSILIRFQEVEIFEKKMKLLFSLSIKQFLNNLINNLKNKSFYKY